MPTIAPYASLGDGFMQYASTSWTTCRDSTSANYSNNFVDNFGAICVINGGNYVVQRGFLPFDTSSIGGGTATAATLKLVVYARNPVTQYYTVSVVSTTATSVVNDQFDKNKWGTTASTTYSSTFGGGAATNALNLTTTPINTSGTTIFGLRSSMDLANTAPATANNWNFCSSDNVTVSYRPVLTVTYTAGVSQLLPPLVHNHMMNQGVV